jgi:hypothetical protein
MLKAARCRSCLLCFGSIVSNSPVWSPILLALITTHVERDLAPLSHVVYNDHQSEVGSCGLLFSLKPVSPQL